MEINLDEKEIYYTGDLNKQQFEILLDWLEKNDTGWEDTNLENIQILNGCDSLKYSNKSWWWKSNEEQTKNALELFNKDSELYKWYKYDDGSLFYVTSECKKGHLYGYGLDKDSWVYYGEEDEYRCVFNNVAKNYKTPATKEEVEERLTQEAIKRGFNVGYESGKYVYFIHDKDWYYNDKSNTFFVRQKNGTWNTIMKDGVWLEIENDKALVGDVIKGTETTDEVSPISLFSAREESLKKTLKYLLKKDIILTPKQYKKLWKKS